MKLDDILFFFMRHAETPDNKKDAYRSWSNAAEAQLAPEGRQVAEDAGRYLKAIGAQINLVVADSLDRVQESIELVMRQFPDAQLQFVRALHPLNMGDWTGKSKKQHPVEPFLKDLAKRIPGGETVAEFDGRQEEIFTKIFTLARDLPGGQMLVGGHGSNVAYLFNRVFHPSEAPVGYEGLVDPGGLIAATPRGLIPLTRVRGGKKKEKRGIIEGVDQVDSLTDPNFGMKVPKGGSNCEKCEYLADNKTDCTQKDFIAWHKLQGAAKPEVIPEKIDEYCCNKFDWKGRKA